MLERVKYVLALAFVCGALIVGGAILLVLELGSTPPSKSQASRPVQATTQMPAQKAVVPTPAPRLCLLDQNVCAIFPVGSQFKKPLAVPSEGDDPSFTSYGTSTHNIFVFREGASLERVIKYATLDCNEDNHPIRSTITIAGQSATRFHCYNMGGILDIAIVKLHGRVFQLSVQNRDIEPTGIPFFQSVKA